MDTAGRRLLEAKHGVERNRRNELHRRAMKVSAKAARLADEYVNETQRLVPLLAKVHELAELIEVANFALPGGAELVPPCEPRGRWNGKPSNGKPAFPRATMAMGPGDPKARKAATTDQAGTIGDRGGGVTPLRSPHPTVRRAVMVATKLDTTAQTDAPVIETMPADNGGAHGIRNVERAPIRPDLLHETAAEAGARWLAWRSAGVR